MRSRAISAAAPATGRSSMPRSRPAAIEPDDAFSARPEQTAQGLMSLADGRDVFVGDEARFFAAPASEDSLAALYAQHPDATLVAGAPMSASGSPRAWPNSRRSSGSAASPASIIIEETATRSASARRPRMRQAIRSLARIDPDLGEIMRRFGSAQVRASGTVGGNIANGSPIGDLAPALIALGRRARAAQGRAHAHHAARKLLHRLSQAGPAAGRIRAPRHRAEAEGQRGLPRLQGLEALRRGYLGRRWAPSGSRSTDAASPRRASPSAAWRGLPKRALETEQALVGVSLDEPAAWGEAMAAIARDFQPLDDHRASAAYRATVARNLVFKALSETASGETRATRIVGQREALEAAE